MVLTTFLTVLFASCSDGSDNFEKIKAALGKDDDTGTLTNYPAFEFAINYKDRKESNVKGSDYENGWYLPTVSELYDIYKEIKTIDAALEKCGGSKFDASYYLSSSQHHTFPTQVSTLFFDNGSFEEANKADSSRSDVCVIRVFN